jgi:hypothetical protein
MKAARSRFRSIGRISGSSCLVFGCRWPCRARRRLATGGRVSESAIGSMLMGEDEVAT